MTPDDNPIIGWTGPAGLYTAAGFSGHGMCIAPGIAGPAAAEILGADAGPGLDLGLYRPERFRVRGRAPARGHVAERAARRIRPVGCPGNGGGPVTGPPAGRGPARVSHSSHWGAFHACTQDGQLTGVEPFPTDPEPSPLLTSIPDALTADCRVRQPAVRRSWLEGVQAGAPGSHPGRRGADEFVEVPWPDAIALVAGELRRVREQHGNDAILGGSYGWSSAGRFHHAKTQLARFLNCFGGFTDQKHNYSFAAALALLPHVVGTASVVGGEVTSWSALHGQTQLWVAFGGLPQKNTQVEAGGIAAHGSTGWLRRMRDSGTRFVNVSPLRDDMPADLGGQWLALRPGSDTALMLGLAHTLVRHGWHDPAFLARYCAGYPRFERYLLGADDGEPKTAAWAAAITGLAPDAIESLARDMAEHRTFISTTWSLQRADHGEQPYWMTITLAAMLGQIGLRGGGFGFGFGNSAGIGNPRLPFAAPALPTGPNPAASWIPVARMADLLLNPGGDYDFNGERRRYPDIRLVYWAGGNPFHHHQDLNRLIAAWRRPETIVIHEPWWTASARHADIVLPATTTLERNDIGAASRDRWLMAMKQAVPPMHGARNDYDIFTDLAAALGIRDGFTLGRDEMSWIRALYEGVRQRAAAADLALPEFAEFWAGGGTEISHDGELVLFADFRVRPGRPSAAHAVWPHRDLQRDRGRLRLRRLPGLPLLAAAEGMAGQRAGRPLPPAPAVQPAALAPARPAGHGPGQPGDQDRRPGTLPDEPR